MKTTALLLMLLFSFAWSTEVLARDADAGRMAGEQAAEERIDGTTWFAIGCLTLGMSYIYPTIWPPQAPQSALIGQDVDYAAAYAEAYEARARHIIQRNSCFGWVIGLFDRQQ